MRNNRRTPGDVVSVDPEVFLKDMAEDDRMGHVYWGARLALAHKDTLRYSGKQWYHWNGKVWHVDPGEVMQAAQRVIAEAVLQGDKTPAVTDSFLKSIVSQASAHMTFDFERWDSARSYINLRNGIYDFNKRRFRGHQPKANMTKIAFGGYDEDQPFDEWDKFLRGMPTMRDRETRRYLQKLFGLVLNGEHHREIFPILLGPGNTGRSRLMDALHTALGEYAHAGATTLLRATKGMERHTTEVFALKGKRLVRVDELARNVRYDDGKVKMLTGGDRVNGRAMRQDDTDFLPTHTLMLTTNHPPVLPQGDSALERRVRVVPFDKLDKPNGEYSELVRTQDFADAVITWAIRGWELFADEGIDELPDAVSEATDRMWRSTNVVAKFVDEACDYVTRLSEASTTRELHLAFEQWQREEGILTPYRERAFGAELTRLGHPPVGNRKARQGLKSRIEESADVQ